MNDRRSIVARGYLEARVLSASPAELISLLYEGLVRELRLASKAVEQNDLVGKGLAFGHALGILGELRASLNHESGGDLASNLERLYMYWTGQITRANIECAGGLLPAVIRQVEDLRQGWNEGVLVKR